MVQILLKPTKAPLIIDSVVRKSYNRIVFYQTYEIIILQG